jgi:hypothetical protein
MQLSLNPVSVSLAGPLFIPGVFISGGSDFIAQLVLLTCPHPGTPVSTCTHAPTLENNGCCNNMR